MRGPDSKLPLHWFATAPDAPLFVFANIWTRCTTVRKAHEGEVTIDIFASSPPPSPTPSWRRSTPSHAGDPDRGRRDRDMADGAVGRGQAPAAAPSRRTNGTTRGCRVNGLLFSAVVLAVSVFALWHRSTVRWIIAAVANAGAAWLSGPVKAKSTPQGRIGLYPYANDASLCQGAPSSFHKASRSPLKCRLMVTPSADQS